MVAAVRTGQSQRAVARERRVALSTVQYWCARAGTRPLHAVDWADRPRGPRQPANRTPYVLEELILAVREWLRATSDLGEYGARAVQRELQRRGAPSVPALSTINRILARRGVQTRARRVRRRAPPPGWYLPAVRDGQAELDAFDGIEGLKLKDGPLVEVLTAISLHGALADAWPSDAWNARLARDKLLARWRTDGLPDYAQFDNDTVFQGPHQHTDVISSVMRLCLSLAVTVVFVPPRETGFQAAVEGFNGRWQAKVWQRTVHASLAALQVQSATYVAAHRQHHRVRADSAPPRRPFPADWQLDLQAEPKGLVIFLRRTDARGAVTFLGRTWVVDETWIHRLVRCELDLTAGEIRCYRLRRREPTEQPLLARWAYRLPKRRFRE